MRQQSKTNRIFILLIYLVFIAYKIWDAVKAYRQNDAFKLYWSVGIVVILAIVFIVLLVRYNKKPATSRNPL